MRTLKRGVTPGPFIESVFLDPKEMANQRQAEADQHWHPYTEPFEAYLTSDYTALHELEQREIAEFEKLRSEQKERASSNLTQ